MKLFLVVVIYLFQVSTAYSSWLIIGNIALSSPFGRHMCGQMPLVPQQKHQCEKDPSIMASIRDGAHLSIRECQHQFRSSRWNCSTVSKGNGAIGNIVQKEKPHLILTVYRSGSQEAAFVHAITSAGVTYAVTQACSRGDLEDCSCDKKKRGESENGSFLWGGCSDDVKYGMKFAENFIDASETDQHDARASMNRHNNRVGRRAVKKFIKRKCKCHGQTASCPTRTCWDEIEDFRKTGDYLKSQFNKAAHVTVRQDGSIMRVHSGTHVHKRLNRDHLVYLESSPNYCQRNLETGSLGTSGRECNKSSRGEDGCAHLCCGRGYDTQRVKRIEKCHCKFHWCCEVICQNCTRELDVHTCKPEVDGVGNAVESTSGAPSNSTVSKESIPLDGGKRRKCKRRKNKKRGRKCGKKRKGIRRSKRDVDENVKEMVESIHKSIFGSNSEKANLNFDAEINQKLHFLFQEQKNIKKLQQNTKPQKQPIQNSYLHLIWSRLQNFTTILLGKT